MALKDRLKRLEKSPFKSFLVVGIWTFLFVLVSSFVFFLIGRKYGWTFFDCIYFVVLTVTTVGYGEVIDFSKYPDVERWARSFSMLVMVWGYVLMLYFVSSLTQLFVSGAIREFFRNRRHRKMMAKLENHYIVCGLGEMGFNVARELHQSHRNFVVIDKREDIFEFVEKNLSPNIPVVKGDASDDEVLKEAGILKAKGLVTTLSQDKDNLFVIVTARALNPSIRIATRCVHESAEKKLRNAGADSVILPARIGGMRMASELIRPTAVTFLDLMLRDKDKNLRVDEIYLDNRFSFIGKTIKDSALKSKANIVIMAVYDPFRGEFKYNPPADMVLHEGMTLIVLGESKDIAKFREDSGVMNPNDDFLDF